MAQPGKKTTTTEAKRRGKSARFTLKVALTSWPTLPYSVLSNGQFSERDDVIMGEREGGFISEFMEIENEFENKRGSRESRLDWAVRR